MERSNVSARTITGGAALALSAAVLLGACGSGSATRGQPPLASTTVVTVAAPATSSAPVSTVAPAPGASTGTGPSASAEPTSLQSTLNSVDAQLGRLDSQVGQSANTTEPDPSQP